MPMSLWVTVFRKMENRDRESFLLCTVCPELGTLSENLLTWFGPLIIILY